MMIKNQKVYDVLKFIAQIALPAFGTLYFTLAAIWSLPSADQVVQTVLAVDTFLGVLLGISTMQYNRSEYRFDGQIDVIETQTKRTLAMDFKEPEEIHEKEDVTLKVNKPREDLEQG